MRLTLVLAIALLMSTAACTKPGALQWKPSPQFALLPVDDDAWAQQQMRDAILSLQRVHFAYNSSELNEVSRDALAEAHEKLGKRQIQLFVEGHADERGSTEYNITLGEKRSTAVANYLAALGVDKSRLHVVSYGEERPLVEAHTEAAFAKNRRVDFRITRGEFEVATR